VESERNRGGELEGKSGRQGGGGAAQFVQVTLIHIEKIIMFLDIICL
jgi:hypothetical protein